jgi:hypothetical protein
MQRMRREGVEGAPGLVPWRGKGRSGTGVFAWCLSEFVGIEYKQPNSLGPTEVIRSTRSPKDNVYHAGTCHGRVTLPRSEWTGLRSKEVQQENVLGPGKTV